MKRKLSIRLKLILSVSALIMFTIALVMGAVTFQVTERINSDIARNFKEKSELFGRIQEIRSRQLAQTAILLADVPSLRAAVSTQDSRTINQKLRDELRVLLDFDPVVPDSLIPDSYFYNADSAGLLVICNPDGVVLGQLSSIPPSRFSIAERPGLLNALQGEYVTQPSIWSVSGNFYTVISVPIFSADNVIGTLSYGFPYRKMEAMQLARDIGSEVSFFINGNLISTSFTSLTELELLNLSKNVSSAGLEVDKTAESVSFSEELQNQDWQIFVSRMKLFGGAEQPRAYYVIASSYSERIKELLSLQTSIILFGLLGIGFSVVVGIIFASYVSKPIELLVLGIRRMEQGDYSNPVPISSNDELGLLTETFNQLLNTLKERLEMLKFVSNATIEAIRKNLTDRDLGGQRKEVTVFFSDIRGFTKWSEKRPPEEVISMLNETLSFQAEIIKKHGGDIDKFVGDEMVAVFEGEKKDRRAVQAAIDIQIKANQVLKAAGLEIAIGIGINTGAVVMGAMGSDNRLDYTVIGNHVNLGARLCSAAGPHEIILSENTARNLERSTKLIELEPVSVKGIEKPVQIYEVTWKESV
jgi:class 3 adenylate cyclase